MAANTLKMALVLFFLLCCCLIPVPSAASLNVVPVGGTVFVGEQGIDITQAMGTDSRIGWWASGAVVGSSAPDQTVTIPNPTSFFVTPNAFAPYTGNWYRISSNGTPDGIAFNVLDPQLAIQAYDTSLSLDRTNDWVPTGDQVRFTINSNLYTIASQRAQGAPVTIYVQSPDGAQYSSVVDAGGNSHSMVDIPVTTNPFNTDSVGISWNTGNSLYTQGTYVIWAECNMNHMKDNYLATGKTISAQVTVLDQDVNPLIRSGATTAPTSVITTAPAIAKPTSLPPTITHVPTSLPTTPAVTVAATPVTTSEIPTETTNIQSQPSTPVTTSPGFDAVFCATALFAGVICCRKKI